jgi:hypothetical protein
MKERIKVYILWAIGGAILYFFLSNHIIIYDGGFELLKKTELNLEYTFFSLKDRKPEAIMKIDALREAGIGELLVDLGRINERTMLKLEEKYGYEEE